MREKYNFETIHSVIVSSCEFEPTVRQSMKSWNMTIQYWLAAYVYKRFPVKSLRYGYIYIYIFLTKSPNRASPVEDMWYI